MQLAYAFDLKRAEDDGLLLAEDDESDCDDAAVVWGQELFAGWQRTRAGLDVQIQAALHRWTIDRLAVVDRSLMRLGSYEILHHTDRVARLVINDYVELAHRYGSDPRTASLVKGVLDRLARERSTPAQS